MEALGDLVGRVDLSEPCHPQRAATRDAIRTAGLILAVEMIDDLRRQESKTWFGQQQNIDDFYHPRTLRVEGLG